MERAQTPESYRQGLYGRDRDVFLQRQHMLPADYELFHYLDSTELQVSLHFHDFYECYLLVSGRIRYQIDSAAFDMKPGDMLLIGPNQLHRPILPKDGEPYERLVLWMSRPYIDSLSTGETPLSRCFETGRHGAYRFAPEVRDALSEKLFSCIAASRSEAFGRDVLCRAALSAFLVSLNRAALDPAAGARRKADDGGVSRRVMRYLDAHLDEPVSLDALSGAVYLSKYYLARAFKRETGTTIHNALVQKRMIYARNLILDGASMQQAAERCGFSDYSAFYKAFKSEYGVTPRAYARNNRR